MANPLFSVIIPVYKAERFLEDAVRSITRQTFSDVEIILVDDCSPDSSPEIENRLAAEDSRIRIIRQEKNSGAAEARNRGIEVAEGKYILFMDSDDVYSDTVLEKAAEETDKAPDVIMWGLVEEYMDDDESITRTVTVTDPDGYYGTPEIMREQILRLEQKGLYGYMWNKAYRAEIIKGRRITHQSFNEDEMFNIALFDDVKSLCVLDMAGTHYRIRKAGSLTHREIPDYYPVAMKRVEALYDQQVRWGTLDGEKKTILANQLIRYIASALERNCHRAAGMTHSDRKAFAAKVRESRMYRELSAYASHSNPALRVLGRSLAKGRVFLPLAIGRTIYIVKTKLTGLFYKAKQEEV